MDDIPRRTWAPFVGAALAALTAGSLVVFSLVAQRTSLDGFPELRIATPAHGPAGTPASITVQPVGSNGDGADTPEPSEVPESTPLALIPGVVTVDSAPADLVTFDAPSGTPASASASLRSVASTRDFDARSLPNEVTLSGRRERGSEDPASHSATQTDARHNGRHTHKSHDAKTNKSKSKRKGASPPGHATAPSGSKSKSSKRATPAVRSKPSHQGPPAHPKAGGNGKSKSKGHKKR